MYLKYVRFFKFEIFEKYHAEIDKFYGPYLKPKNENYKLETYALKEFKLKLLDEGDKYSDLLAAKKTKVRFYKKENYLI